MLARMTRRSKEISKTARELPRATRTFHRGEAHRFALAEPPPSHANGAWVDHHEIRGQTMICPKMRLPMQAHPGRGDVADQVLAEDAGQK